MARSLSSIEKELRELGSSDQEALLKVLVEELDGPPDRDADDAWLEEAQRRNAELDSGAARCIPADEVFRKVDAQL